MQSPTSSQHSQKFTNPYPEIHKSINIEINKFMAAVGRRRVVGRRTEVGTTVVGASVSKLQVRQKLSSQVII